jgi:hypothetical protein
MGLQQCNLRLLVGQQFCFRVEAVIRGILQEIRHTARVQIYVTLSHETADRHVGSSEDKPTQSS